MDPTLDELAGTVDGFGGLTRDELTAALEDLAARTGSSHDPERIDAQVDAAVSRYYLLEVDAEAVESPDGDPPDDLVLVPGPAALPELPPGGEDLPHLLEIGPRTVDRENVARLVEGRLRTDAAATIDADDPERAAELLDACYELEAWGPVDLADVRAALAERLE